MRKKRRNKSVSKRLSQRDISNYHKPEIQMVLRRQEIVNQTLDKRFFTPQYYPELDRNLRPVRYQIIPPKVRNLPDKKKYRDETLDRVGLPKRAMLCKRRLKRRQTLFKAGKIGKGIRGPKFKRNTDTSDLRCK